MSYIQSAIELTDRMSAPLYNICTAANMVISNFQAMQYASDAAFDTSSLDVARQNIADAVVQLQELTQEKVKISEPVTIPVQWQEYNAPEVFLTTGAERFQQEIQSANNMMEQLCATQDSIAKQAYSTYIFPPEAFQNLNSMAVRIDHIRDKISQLETSGAGMGFDAANSGIERLREQLSQTLQIQSELNYAVQNMDVSAANSAYLKLSQTVDNTERYIRDNTNEQMQFNDAVYAGTTQTDALTGAIKRVVAAYVSIQSVQKALNLSDELTQTTARLDMMVSSYNTLNGTMQTTDELTQMIYQSAQNSRASFMDTAASVAKLGNNARDAFASTGEIVQFAELVNKQFTIAGASSTEASNAFLQLTQALGSGVLRGDELNSIFEQAPNLIQTVADYMDVPIGQIREMASEGQITADIVKNAMFAAADDIDAKFNSMPMTWGQLWTYYSNQALMTFQPVLQRLNEIANDANMRTALTGVMNALSGAATVALNVIDVMVTGGAFIVDNWSMIAPVIIGVGTALAVYNGVLMIHNAYETLANGLKAISAARSALKSGMTLAEAAATKTATGAQVGMNAALLACPVTWVIVAIIALIAILYAVVAHINKTKDEATSATGVICGAVYAAGAFILNTAIGVLNGLIQSAWNIFVEPVLSIVEWVLNVMNGGFDSFGGAVANLIGNIISWFLSLGKVVTQIIDAIFGTNWTSGLESLQNEVLSWGKTENAITLDRSAPTIDYRMSYTDAYSKGYEWGQGIENTIKDFFGGAGAEDDNFGSYGGESDMTNYLSGIAGDTASISDSLDVSEEDLKYLRDIAEQEAINRFTTAEIKVDMSGMSNTVHNTNDLDGIVDGLTTRVLQAMEVVRDGA